MRATSSASYARAVDARDAMHDDLTDGEAREVEATTVSLPNMPPYIYIYVSKREKGALAPRDDRRRRPRTIHGIFRLYQSHVETAAASPPGSRARVSLDRERRD